MMIHMYAVYGLDEDKRKIEAFIGYVPATFFDIFTDSSLWSVATAIDSEGRERVGRLYGRAFFVHASNLKARTSEIIKYMGHDADKLWSDDLDLA